MDNNTRGEHGPCDFLTAIDATTHRPKAKRNITIGCGVVVVQDCMILTMRRLGGWWPGQLALVGGHPEEGEGVFNTAVRETLEETGLIVVPRRVNGYSPIFHANEWISQPISRFKHHFSVYVVADVVGGTLANREPQKHEDLRFMTLSGIMVVAEREDLPLMPIGAMVAYRNEIGI